MRYRIVLAVLAGLVPVGVAGASEPPPSAHYDLKLDVDPPLKQIFVSGTVELPVVAGASEVRFFLQRHLRVTRLTGPQVAAVVPLGGAGVPRSMPAAQQFRVSLKEAASKNTRVRFEIAYGGRIGVVPEQLPNTIGASWTELGLNFPWYPYPATGAPATARLRVRCPKGYEVRGYEPFREDGGEWVVESTIPRADLLVTIARGFRDATTEGPGGLVRLHAPNLGEPQARTVIEALRKGLDLMAGWYGPLPGAQVTLIQSLRTHGGGYSRPGLIVMPLTDEWIDTNLEDLVRHLCREASRLFWGRAPKDSWEDWLNGSFAGHAALRAVRERFGNEAYQRRLKEKREQSVGLPALWGFDRSDLELADRMIYGHGTVLLAELEDRIGREPYERLCRTLIGQGVATTEGLLAALEAQEGKEARGTFERLLRSPVTAATETPAAAQTPAPPGPQSR